MSVIVTLLNQPFVLKVLELLVGITTVASIMVRNVVRGDDLTKRELLKMIEEKDRQLERLTIQVHAHRMRLEHVKKSHKGDACNR